MHASSSTQRQIGPMPPPSEVQPHVSPATTSFPSRRSEKTCGPRRPVAVAGRVGNSPNSEQPRRDFSHLQADAESSLPTTCIETKTGKRGQEALSPCEQRVRRSSRCGAGGAGAGRVSVWPRGRTRDPRPPPPPARSTLPPTPAEPQGIFNQRRDPNLLSPQSPFVAWAGVVSHRPFLSGVTVLRGALENPLEPRWSPACLHRVAQLGFPVGIRVDRSSRQRGSPPCSCRGFRLAGRRSHLAISEATVTPAGGSSASAVRRAQTAEGWGRGRSPGRRLHAAFLSAALPGTGTGCCCWLAGSGRGGSRSSGGFH